MNRFYYFVCGILLLGVCSCSVPMTKESYLKRYEVFINDVSKNHKTFDDKDWTEATRKYEKFSNTWYEKFKDDFTIKEQVTLTGYQVKFHYYHAITHSTSAIKQFFEALKVDNIAARIQHYIEHDMHDGLKKLVDEANAVGKEVEQTIIDILTDLEVNPKEIQDQHAD